jgi:hypothetical protein
MNSLLTEPLPAGSYSGIVRCSTVVLDNAVIGGATVSCRCGAGRWYESREAAEQAADAHRGASR